MKILAVHSALLPNPDKQSQVDHWRIYRPMRELAKHVNWQIDHEGSFIPGMEKYQNLDEFTKEEMEKAFAKICEYDIVFSSYHPDPTAFTMLKVARDRAGVQFVMDSDDDMFAINPDNPFWMKMDDEKVYMMQRMIANNDWICTPSENLAKRYRERRPEFKPDSVEVIPNFIPDDYQHPKFDNSPSIVIGYFGGASHYSDLHDSGVLHAIEKLMHENKNLRFKSVGMVVDKYVPKARFEFDPGKRGTKWLTEVFPSLKIDIAIAPLNDNVFNEGKSNIKWQEATRAGAVFVASNVGPYATLPSTVAKLVKNDEKAWYKALKTLTEKPEKRAELFQNAQKELENWRLENNWQRYKQFFERVTRK